MQNHSCSVKYKNPFLRVQILTFVNKIPPQKAILPNNLCPISNMLGLAVLGHAICTGLLWSSTFNIPVHAKSYNQTLLRAATVVHDSPVNLTTYKYHGPTTSLSKRAASDTMKAALMQSNSQVVIATGVCIATFLTPLGAAICISAGILALVHNFFIFYSMYLTLSANNHERGAFNIFLGGRSKCSGSLKI